MSSTTPHSWTRRVRERAVGALPPDKLLPDKQPAYVTSSIYVFGVLSLAALAVIIASGSILALKGPGWWHFTGVGHFFNSIHLWSVELFFFFMVIHLWGKYWMAAWRGRRARVWITGAITFIVAIPCTFLLVQSQTVRTMPTFLYVIMAAIGIMFTLIGAYIGERIQLGPPPKTAA